MPRDKKQKTDRPKRVKLSPKEIIKRMESLPDRMERIVAAVRKGKNRSVSA
jgi:hypothetical protein